MPIIAGCATLALVGAGCGGGSSSTESTQASTASNSSTSTGVTVTGKAGKKPKVEVTGGTAPKQMVEKELIEGSGAEAKSGDEVTVQYVGVGYKTGEEFDSSWSRHEPFTFALGAGQVIKGWDKGVVGMKVGGRRELILPPSLAYGSAGAPPAIGPNETLVFVIDLLAVK
jgi:peptidylprolyl isomerase